MKQRSAAVFGSGSAPQSPAHLHHWRYFSNEFLSLLANKGLEEVTVDIYTYDDYSYLKAELRARPYPWSKVTVREIEP